VDPETSKGGPTSPADPLPGPEAATPTVKGYGGVLKLPQRVRAEPDRQTFLMHLWPENDVWERLSSLNRLLAELGAKHAF
jgi:hypothetical protein